MPLLQRYWDRIKKFKRFERFKRFKRLTPFIIYFSRSRPFYLLLKPKKISMRSLLSALIVTITLSSISCSNNKSDSGSNKADVLATNLDTTVSPGEDFFQYANGGWIKNNPIPN